VTEAPLPALPSCPVSRQARKRRLRAPWVRRSMRKKDAPHEEATCRRIAKSEKVPRSQKRKAAFRTAGEGPAEPHEPRRKGRPDGLYLEREGLDTGGRGCKLRLRKSQEGVHERLWARRTSIARLRMTLTRDARSIDRRSRSAGWLVGERKLPSCSVLGSRTGIRSSRTNPPR